MTEQRWTTDELDRIGAAEELEIAPRRPGRHAAKRPVPIWVVRVSEDLGCAVWARLGRRVVWRCAAAAHRPRPRRRRRERTSPIADADPELADAIDAAYRDKYARDWS